jgi:simple sugar transport system substrate-binding protein
MRTLAAVVWALCVLTPAFAGGQPEPETADVFRIGVFIPGVVEGSPTYELLVAGVEQAVAEANESAEAAQENALPPATAKVVEGEFNQALWEQGLTSMAASGEYDLIVSSNPEIPDIVEGITENFPAQRFLIMDAYLTGNPAVHTVMFNQREQAFLAGYFAALVSRAESGAGEPVRAGLLAGQEYPIMNNVILPGYELGVRAVDPDGSVDFRVLGNWFDAGRAAELADSMYATGSDVILPIAGSGSQGVIAAAREREKFVVWYDTNGLSQEPGVVIGSTFVALDQAAYERTLEAMEGRLLYGEAEVLGVREGYVGFVEDDPLYRRHVPDEVREAQAEIVARMKSGEFYLEMPLE